MSQMAFLPSTFSHIETTETFETFETVEIFVSHVVSYATGSESLRPSISCGVVPLALSHVRPLQLTANGIIGNQGEDYEVITY